MVFKRRDRLPLWNVVLRALWPKGGWGRAARYVQHRLRRLPDTPEKISRGIWAGVFTTFTPFYGLHFIVAAIIAKFMRGNILASLLATFFGNPLTYLPIGIVSLQTGYWMLGMRPNRGVDEGLGHKFASAGEDLWHNFLSVFTDRTSDWTHLMRFYDEVFFPYMVGGILPGIIAASIAYYLAVPVIRAYQKRRAGKIKAKLAALKAKAAAKAAQKKAAESGK